MCMQIRTAIIEKETGVQMSLTERLVRSRLQWAGHVGRMADDRLPKRAAELREQDRCRRGMPMLRWEDCVKRDVRKAGEEEDWKKNTRHGGGWKRLSDEAVKKLYRYKFLSNLRFADDIFLCTETPQNYNLCYKNYPMKVCEWVLK